MRTTSIITTTDDAAFLGPVKEPITGWSIRPGTFRVAQPYDKVTEGTIEATTEPSAQSVEQGHPRKKQKLSAPESNNDDELTQWLQSTLQLILEKDSTKTYFSSMQQDYFYGTYVGAPANEEFTMDLVKAQPTLQLLRHGFQSSSTNRRRNQADDNMSVEFDEIQLDPDNHQQQLEMTDVYETLVANKDSRPAFINFPTEGQPCYLVPPSSAFIASDFSSIQGLKAIAAQRGGFDMIVMDPPWQNASVDRMGHYGTFDLYELFKIPIPDLLSPLANVKGNQEGGGGVVAVWITNRAKVRKVVVEKLFPAWGLELVAQWYWLKVTTHGEPVLSLDNKHRRPYEGILIGRKKAPVPLGPLGSVAGAEVAPVDTGPRRKLIVSVPSQHSRKPSIMDILSEEYFQNIRPQGTSDDTAIHNEPEWPPSQLELFARTLEEGVLSWGNEPFKYQYCGRGSAPFIQDGYLIPSSTNGTPGNGLS
ncbi:MT-A70-domain-containing protein [Linnemannia elongata]|nr:MT-A70-domain-containing protein [Linnemannia elongata]